MIIENIQTLNTVLHPPGNIRNTKHKDNRYTQTQHREKIDNKQRETDRDRERQIEIIKTNTERYLN